MYIYIPIEGMPCFVSSLDTDRESQGILANLSCYESSYGKKLAGTGWRGQLTDEGIQQMLALGQRLRRRYIQELSFLPPVMLASNNSSSSNRLLYTSTNYARCIFSADALLQGLFKSGGGLVPIFVDQARTPYYGNPGCERWAKVVSKSNTDWIKALDSDEFLQLKRAIFKRYNSNYNDSDSDTDTDSTNTTIKTIVDNNLFYDAIVCRLAHNLDLLPLPLPLPLKEQQINESNKQKMKAEEEKQVFGKYCKYSHARMIRYRSRNRQTMRYCCGVLLHKLAREMAVCEGLFHISSCHDVTIVNLLIALSNANSEGAIAGLEQELGILWPGYADCLVFEVWERKKKNEEGGGKADELLWLRLKQCLLGIGSVKCRYVRVMYNDKCVHLRDGEQFIELAELKGMWLDLMVSEAEFWAKDCVC